MGDDIDVWQRSAAHAGGGVSVLAAEINPILSKKNMVATIQWDREAYVWNITHLLGHLLVLLCAAWWSVENYRKQKSRDWTVNGSEPPEMKRVCMSRLIRQGTKTRQDACGWQRNEARVIKEQRCRSCSYVTTVTMRTAIVMSISPVLWCDSVSIWWTSFPPSPLHLPSFIKVSSR